jgi:hypothetical protein
VRWTKYVGKVSVVGRGKEEGGIREKFERQSIRNGYAMSLLTISEHAKHRV